ncbi:MAG: hypothetical protein EPN14_08110 [Gallionella sp.]|nr:MAG: hypothetical protein EPN14_08110 [Gallionella sp.]
MANYANLVIGYALADAALKNGSKSSCTKVHSGFSPFFALPQLRSLRCAEVLWWNRVELMFQLYVRFNILRETSCPLTVPALPRMAATWPARALCGAPPA